MSRFSVPLFKVSICFLLCLGFVTSLAPFTLFALDRNSVDVESDDKSRIAIEIERVKAKRTEVLRTLKGWSNSLYALTQRVGWQQSELIRRYEKRMRDNALVKEGYLAELDLLEPHLEAGEIVEIDERRLTPSRIRERHSILEEKIALVDNLDALYPVELALVDEVEWQLEQNRRLDVLRTTVFQTRLSMNQIEGYRLGLRDLRDNEIIYPKQDFSASLENFRQKINERFEAIAELQQKQSEFDPTEPWIPIFTGESLAGWSSSIGGDTRRRTPPDSIGLFRCQAGRLFVDRLDPNDPGSSLLVFQEQLKNYEIRFFLRFRGNVVDSMPDPGILLQVQDPDVARLPDSPVAVKFPLGPELEKLPLRNENIDLDFVAFGTSWENELDPERIKELTDQIDADLETSREYRMRRRIWRSRRMGRPRDRQWIQVYVRVVDGVRTQVVLNGDQEFSVDRIVLDSEDVNVVRQEGKIRRFEPGSAEMGAELKLENGYFALQAGGRPMEIRGISLRRLHD